MGAILTLTVAAGGVFVRGAGAGTEVAQPANSRPKPKQVAVAAGRHAERNFKIKFI
jgi:hypothetical protein